MRPRHAFLVRESALIPPLGAPASEAWLLDAPLYDRMRRVCAEAGLAVERVESLAEAEERTARTPEGAVVALDSVAFSPAVLRDLVRALGERRGVRAERAHEIAQHRG